MMQPDLTHKYWLLISVNGGHVRATWMDINMRVPNSFSVRDFNTTTMTAGTWRANSMRSLPEHTTHESVTDGLRLEFRMAEPARPVDRFHGVFEEFGGTIATAAPTEADASSLESCATPVKDYTCFAATSIPQTLSLTKNDLTVNHWLFVGKSGGHVKLTWMS